SPWLTDQIIILLQYWSESLVSLKLWFKFLTPTMILEPEIRAVVERLLVTINSMSALKNLSFDCRHYLASELDWIKDSPDRGLDMPVLSRLERFHFHSLDTISIVLGSLIKVSVAVKIAHVIPTVTFCRITFRIQYSAPNSNLIELAIENRLTDIENEYMQMFELKPEF